MFPGCDSHDNIAMMIEFECENQVFNALLGRNEPCGHRIAVPDTKIGDLVPCPKCRNDTEVPFNINRNAPRSRPDPPLSVSPPSDSNPTPAPRTRRPETSSSAGHRGKPKSGGFSGTRRSISADDDYQLSSPLKRSKSDLSAIDFGAEDATSVPQTDRRYCEKCGAVIDRSGCCASCGFRARKFDKATQPIDQIKVGLAGFQLWFVQTMTESIPFKTLEYATHGAIALLAILAISISIFGVVFSGHVFVGVVMVVLIGLALALYVALVVQGHRLAKDPHARLAWFQLPFWNILLWLARRGNWQSYDQRFEGRMIIDRRGEGFTDQHISGLEGLSKCEVLDLEGTLITDQGLHQLYGLPNLHCIVLKKTNVTHEGVFRLQQAHSKVWIWY
jgi:hypothetical protein